MTVQPVDLVLLGEPSTTESWLVSDWMAGQSSIVEWDAANVRSTTDGGIELVLGASPAGSPRPYYGGEVQSIEQAATGTWTWTAQAPVMQDGAVFGLFTYQADWQADPWLEFDFEFVGADTTKVELNIHMEDAAGRHITLAEAKGGPVVVDLGFDAAQGMHTYEIVSTATEVFFLVDGRLVGRYGAADMPGGVWYSGDMKGFADLWAVDAGQEAWAGDWAYGGTPLVGKIATLDVRPGDLSPLTDLPPEQGAGDDVLTGTLGDDVLAGLGGNDTLSGDAGNDRLSGGVGDDLLLLDAGNDTLDGGTGIDEVRHDGLEGVTIDLSLTLPQDTRLGRDTVLGIENATGGGGADILSGGSGGNALSGRGGDDALSGRAGNDSLDGGDGNDTLDGGDGNDTVLGGTGDDRLVLNLGDDLIDGGSGVDTLVVQGSAGATINLSNGTAQATGYGTDRISQIENVIGGSGSNNLTGSSGANVLSGKGGNDSIKGQGGADVLIGGLGRDTISGGADQDMDRFVFRTVADSAVGTKRDSILQFVSGVDDIDLSGIDVRANIDGDQAFGFTGTTAMAYSVWYAASRGDATLRADVTGDGRADLEIKLVGVTHVTAGDFIL